MPNNRVDAVVSDIVDAVRSVLEKHEVTFDEYRKAFGHLIETQNAGEIPLLVDLFFNTTICKIENDRRRGSTSSLEGPYFLEGAPEVAGELKTFEDDDGKPMLLCGKVTDVDGNPLPDTVIDVWHSTPDGRYGGCHAGVPMEYYRGKVRTKADGSYEVRSKLPVPYHIPDQGPVGALLAAMGRHSWRPAHVHYKIRKDGYETLTTQAYFEGGEWINDDCCEGVFSDLIQAAQFEDGARVMDVDFALDPAA
jgi:chlorocatechol 1,2-dioxygenase